MITNFTVITGASKGIDRAAADALVEQGWSVIGIARSSPRSFPGVFIETDLADPDQTRALADDLAPRGDVFGIVNSGGRISFELRRVSGWWRERRESLALIEPSGKPSFQPSSNNNWSSQQRKSDDQTVLIDA